MPKRTPSSAQSQESRDDVIAVYAFIDIPLIMRFIVNKVFFGSSLLTGNSVDITPLTS